MGIDRTDYIVYGWKLPYDLKDSKGDKIDFWDDKYLPMIEGHENEKYSIIIDGMSGEYVVFGIIIAQADESCGWNFVKLNQKQMIPDSLNFRYREVIDEHGPAVDPHLFIFSHFS
jgi:hypothetical protein